jgi:phage-related protein
MASRIAEAYVQIVPRIDGVASGISNELSGSMSMAGAAGAAGFAGGFSRILGPALILGGAAALGGFAKSAFNAAQESTVANARIEQIAKSMDLFGSETKIVTTRLDSYASSVMKSTGVDDESIKVIQAKLLTFKELGATADETGGAFDRATVAAIDLAAAGFGSAEQNAVQLGKALQDPIKGIAALGRSGVTFTDIEKEKIKVLVESGQILEAQELVLSAIEKQVGGTAQATLTGTQLMATAYGEVKEALGGLFEGPVNNLARDFATKVLFPLSDGITRLKEIFEVEGIGGILAAFSDMRTKVFTAVSQALPGIIDAIIAFIPTLITNTSTMLISILNTLTASLPQLIDGLVTFFMAFVDALIIVIPQIITALTNAIPQIIEALIATLPQIIDGAIALFNGLIEGLLKVLPVLIQAVIDLIPIIVDALITMLPEIIEGAIQLFLGLIQGLTEALPEIITAVVDAIPEIIDAIVEQLPLIIDGAIDLFMGIIDGLILALPDIIAAIVENMPKIVGALLGAIPQFVNAGFQLIGGLVSGILGAIPNLVSALLSGIGKAIDAGKKALGIKSPSRVFMSIGGNVMAGLSDGILNNASLPIKAIDGVAKKLTIAGESTSLNGMMPSLVSPQSSAGAVGNSSATAQTINYYAAPNQSLDAEQALLQAVKRARVITGW